MKTYLVFPQFGEVTRIKATDMVPSANSIRFLHGKKVVAIFNFSEVRKAGESQFFPETKEIDAQSISVETINNFFRKMPQSETNSLPN